MKIVTLIMMMFLSIYAKNIKEDPIQRIDLKDGTSILRIHLNYEDSSDNIHRIRGIDGFYKQGFSMPSKWNIIEAKGYIKYTPSILLLKELSSAVVSFNDVVVSQFKIFDYQKSGIKFDIDPSLFYENNTLKFEAIQHYTNECEDGAHSSLWSDIDLSRSYIELHVRPRPIKELISSIKTDVFDSKQYSVTPLNYVMLGKTDENLKNFALFSSVASTNLKYRIEELKVSSKLDLKNHNLIISSKTQAREILRSLGNQYILDERPSLSMFFNSKSCNTWLNKDAFAQVIPDKNIKITSDGAFSRKSAYFNNNKIVLKDMKIDGAEAVTVAMWFKPDNVKRSVLFGFETYSLMLFNGHIGFNSGNKDLYGVKYKFKSDKWYHVVATFHQGVVDRNSIIINGKRQNLKQLSKNYVFENAKITKDSYIGTSGESTNMYYKGYIDQFYMFDHALTSLSAQKLYSYSLSHQNADATESLFIDDKLAHDINVIQNPYQVDKAIIIIAPEDESRQRELVYALYKADLEKYKRQGLDIKEVSIPEKAPAYSANNFVPLDEKIYFKELGYETKLLKGWYPEKIKMKFKVYPDNFFDSKDRMVTNFHYVLPTVVHDDSVANTFLNGNFANQVDIMKTADETQIKIAANKLFNFDSKGNMPAYLIGKGFNELSIDFSLVPMKKGSCEVYNTENLVASVLDDSYFILPKSTKWIELPYMELITNAQFPYSIYPDLQDTVLLLANTDNDTIASAMNFVFFLTQELGSYPNYLKVTSSLSAEDREKNIIVFGTVNDEKLQVLSKNAPIAFSKEMMKKDYPYISKFVEHKSIINKDRLKKYSFMTSMKETNLVDSSIVMQMLRSPFNGDKTILMFAANTPYCLNSGVNSIFKYKNRNNIAGDTVIYDYIDEEGIAYNIKDKYIISDLTWLDSLALRIGANPIIYIFVFLILLIIFVWLVRMLLRQFKRDHHSDAE